MSLASTIFGTAAAAVDTPGGSLSATHGAQVPRQALTFPDIAHPDTAPSAGAAGPVPAFTLHTPPAATSITVNPTAAAYAAVTSAIAWGGAPAAVAPEYSTAVLPETLPSVVPPPPPALVQQAQVLVTRYAGREAVAAPTIRMGERSGLLRVELASFTPETIEPLELDLSRLGDVSLDTAQLAPPSPLQYSDDAALLERIRTTLAGSDLLTDAEQAALFDDEVREQAREDMRATRKILSAAAARGFSMPAGPVTAQVAEVANASRQRKLAAATKVRDEAYEMAKRTLLEACTRVIALETKHFALHTGFVAKLIQSVRFNLRMQVDLYNATVRLFNDKVSLVKAVVGAYKEYVSAVLTQDEGVVAQVRGELAKVGAYRAEVEMFSAQAGTLKTFAEVESLGVRAQVQALQEYEAYLIGVRANLDITKRNIDAFRAAVGTMKDAAELERAKFAAYADNVGATSSAEDVISANVQAYAGFWRAEGARGNAFSSYVDSSLRALNAEVREYTDYAQAQRSYLSVLASRVDAELDNLRLWGQGQRSRAQAVSAYNRATAEVTGAKNAQALANASMKLTNDILEQQAAAEEDRINAARAAADITAAAGLETARLAVRSASVQIRGDVDGRRAGASEKSGQIRGSDSISTRYVTDHSA